MNIWLLIFLTFSHFQHKYISCISCHDIKNPQKMLQTNKKTCEKCHQSKNNNKKYVFKLKDTNGIKFNHELHYFLSCSNCHTINENNITKPEMKTCNNCHNPKTNSNKPNCATCHTYNKKFITHYKNKIYKPLSHNKFNYKIKHIVTNENYCLQCHQKSYCLKCHNSLSKFNSTEKFHPLDYITIHKYEKNLNSCSSCHKQEKDCKACHQKSGIDTSNLEKQNREYRIHPKNWNHGNAAYKNINSCVSCHTENDCLSCHKKDENPHKKVKNICKRAVREKRSCEKCHQKVREVCP